LLGLGEVLFRMRRFEEALAHFRTAAQINPNDAESLNLLRSAYSKLGQPAHARAALERSIEVAPRYAFAHYDLGTVLAAGAEADGARALKCFDTAIELDPSLAWADYAAGCIHARAGKGTLQPRLESPPLFADTNPCGRRKFRHTWGVQLFDFVRPVLFEANSPDRFRSC